MIRLVILGALCLWAGTPPTPVPGGEFLMIAGLMAWFRLADEENVRRRYLAVWLLGMLHTWAFSFSLIYHFPAGWAPIGPVAGLYWMLATWVYRGLVGVRVPRVLAFGLACALCFWLRANMPEIQYPHGQPAHAFYQWRSLMEPVRWGGEIGANMVWAAAAAALVLLARAWRTGEPRWGRARWAAGITLSGIALLCVVPAPARPSVAGSLRIAAMEPGASPAQFLGAGRPFLPELVAATQALAGPEPAVVDLVLWPESSHPGYVEEGPGGASVTYYPGEPVANLEALDRIRLASGTRLLAGATFVESREDRIWRPCAVLLDERGGYVDRQDKVVCVPGGEAIPLARWIPALKDFGSSLGVANFTPGELRPPLQLPSGDKVAGVTCFENCFPWVAAAQVREGARLMAVVTNEAWYEGGGELDQMDAASVCRALETDTPLVRCTTNGRTMAVSREGRITAFLPPGEGSARNLTVEMELGPGVLPPMAWLHSLMPWLVAAAGIVGSLHNLSRRGRLPRLRQQHPAGAAPSAGGS